MRPLYVCLLTIIPRGEKGSASVPSLCGLFPRGLHNRQSLDNGSFSIFVAVSKTAKGITPVRRMGIMLILPFSFKSLRAAFVLPKPLKDMTGDIEPIHHGESSLVEKVVVENV